MRVFYALNERLPGPRAHDIYVYNQCAALAQAGAEVHLLVGHGSASAPDLARHHGWSEDPGITVVPRFLWRRNTMLGTSWSYPFNAATWLHLRGWKPDIVLTHLPKQARVYLRHHDDRTRYVYDAHEPPQPKHGPLVARFDCVMATTEPLREQLRAPPFSFPRIEVPPYAVKASPLPPPEAHDGRTRLMYVGSFFDYHDLHLLLEALAEVPGVEFECVGGNPPDQFEEFQARAQALGVADRVTCHGQQPPEKLSEFARRADAFVQPFSRDANRPNIVSTKVMEYAVWGRPQLVPDFPSDRSLLQSGKGVIFFGRDGLADAMREIADPARRAALQAETSVWSGAFSWEARAQAQLALFEDLLSS
ncbi:MAG: glycosyltransferase family 4 protein [Planctomycetota bacterium]|jgi:glycosyltransferase involved in cell wall biosynthesis